MTARVAAAASATYTGHDAGGLVAVTVAGTGDVMSVQVGGRAQRDLDARSLAGRLAEAANAALARAEAALSEVASMAGDEGVLQRLASFDQRLDVKFEQLDRVERRLADLGD